MLRRHSGRLGCGRQRLDALALTGKHQPSAVITQWFGSIRVSNHAHKARDIRPKPRFTVVRHCQIHPSLRCCGLNLAIYLILQGFPLLLFYDSVRLEHVPEKWQPVFRKKTCSNKKIEQDDDSKKSPSINSKNPCVMLHPARSFPDQTVSGFSCSSSRARFGPYVQLST